MTKIKNETANEINIAMKLNEKLCCENKLKNLIKSIEYS